MFPLLMLFGVLSQAGRCGESFVAVSARQQFVGVCQVHVTTQIVRGGAVLGAEDAFES